MQVIETLNKKLLFGSINNLMLLDLTHFTLEKTIPLSTADNYIYLIHKDIDGQIWISVCETDSTQYSLWQIDLYQNIVKK